MKIKNILACALSAGLLMSGCADTTTVTQDNAPSETIAALAGISSDSTPEEVLDAFEMLISQTAQAYDYKLEMRNTTENSTPFISGEDLESQITVMDQRDIRYADANGVYELLEQSSQGNDMLGLMHVSNDSTDTVYANYVDGGFNQAHSSAMIQSITQDKSETTLTPEEVETSAHNMVTYPLYALVGANLILQPFAFPEYYTFTLSKDGSDYVFDMNMKDSESYNEYLDTYVETNYGYSRTDLNGNGMFIADLYDTQSVDIKLTLDENGVIKKIINNNFNVIKANGKDVNAYTKQTSLLSKAPADAESFFADFFAQVKDGGYKEGDVFTLTLAPSAGEQEAADADHADNSEAANGEENKDAAENSSEAGTSDSESTQEENKDQADTPATQDAKDDTSDAK